MYFKSTLYHILQGQTHSYCKLCGVKRTAVILLLPASHVQHVIVSLCHCVVCCLFPGDGTRRSGGKGKKNPLHVGLISKPQNDLRHTGHVGFDGALFGDVSFIGDNYDKLPVKVVSPCKFCV